MWGHHQAHAGQSVVSVLNMARTSAVCHQESSILTHCPRPWLGVHPRTILVLTMCVVALAHGLPCVDAAARAEVVLVAWNGTDTAACGTTTAQPCASLVYAVTTRAAATASVLVLRAPATMAAAAAGVDDGSVGVEDAGLSRLAAPFLNSSDLVVNATIVVPPTTVSLRIAAADDGDAPDAGAWPARTYPSLAVSPLAPEDTTPLTTLWCAPGTGRLLVANTTSSPTPTPPQTVVVENLAVTGCGDVSLAGGVAWVAGNVRASFVGVDLFANHAAVGGVVAASGRAVVNVSRTHAFRNVANGTGGVVAAWGNATVDMSACGVGYPRGVAAPRSDAGTAADLFDPLSTTCPSIPANMPAPPAGQCAGVHNVTVLTYNATREQLRQDGGEAGYPMLLHRGAKFYPSPAPACVWELRVPRGSGLRLEFCNYPDDAMPDFVQCADGHDLTVTDGVTGQVLRAGCAPLTPIVAASHVVRVQYSIRGDAVLNKATATFAARFAPAYGNVASGDALPTVMHNDLDNGDGSGGSSGSGDGISMGGGNGAGGVASGGAGGAVLVAGNAVLRVDNTTFVSSFAGGAGGDVAVTGVGMGVGVGVGVGAGAGGAASVITVSRTTSVGGTSAYGGSVWVGGNASADVSDSTVAQGVASAWGGGMAVTHRGRLQLRRVTHTTCGAVEGGGGVAVLDDAAAHAVACDWRGGMTNVGGGGVACGGGGAAAQVVVSTSRLRRHALPTSVTTSGGAVWVSSSCRVALHASDLSDNSAKNGGALAVAHDGGVLNVTGSTMVSNRASRAGGVLAMTAGSAAFRGCHMELNQAPSQNGGFGDLRGAARVSVVDSTLHRHTAKGMGGVLFLREDADARVHNCSVTQSTARGIGGGVFGVTSVAVRLTVSRSRFTDNTATSGDGGVWLFSSFSATAAALTTFTDCVFAHNRAASGTLSAQAAAARLLVQGCVFDANVVTVTGGGVYVSGAADVTLSSCVFSANQAATGGAGAYFAASVTATVTDCAFVRNVVPPPTAYTTGLGSGAVTLEQQVALRLVRCNFTGNTAFVGAAVYASNIYLPSTIAAEACHFVDNVATPGLMVPHNGGAVGIVAATTLVFAATNCTWRGNRGHFGGGVSLQGFGAQFTASGCVMAGNAAEEVGGAVHATAQSNVALTQSRLEGNAARSGAGVAIEDHVTLAVTDTVLRSNVAMGWGTGGGVLVQHDSHATLARVTAVNNTAGYGGVAHTNLGCTLLATACTFVANTARDAGGVLVVTSDGRADVSDSTAVNNTALARAGVVDVEQTAALSMLRCDMAGNTAPYGGVLFGSNDGVATLAHCRVGGNTAQQDGGGVNINHAFALRLEDVNISQCVAVANGGGVVASGTSQVSMAGVHVQACSARRGGGLYVGATCTRVGLRCVVWCCAVSCRVLCVWCGVCCVWCWEEGEEDVARTLTRASMHCCFCCCTCLLL